MKRNVCLILSCTIFSFCSFSQNGQDPPTKKQYSVFNPTPAKDLRAMETDRPDITESSYTVDAGHFQYEGDLSRFTILEDNRVRSRKIAFNNGTYKLGVTNSLDVHLVFETYVINYLHNNSGTNSIAEGLGDINLRLKKNITGNDGGKFALAVLPFIKIPALSFYKNNHIEWGLIFPYALNYLRDWSLSGEVQMQFLKQMGEMRYKPFYLQSFAAEHELTKKLAFFIETHFTYSDRDRTLANFADGGLILLFNNNLHFDCGINYGIQSYSYKSFFVGMSFRK